jgi:hypothetical protein
MHRMLRKALAAFALGVILLIGTFWLAPVRFVGAYSSKLSVVPFGFHYDQKPFYGVVYSVYEGSLSSLIFVWEGLRHGPDLQWYDNAQLFVERHYQHGLESGTHKAWYKDGRVKSLKSFRNGKAHGESFEWYTNGHPSQFILYDQGREVAAKTWTSGGKPFYNYVWNEGKRIGLEGDRFCSPLKRAL